MKITIMIKEKKVHSAECDKCKKPYHLLCGHSFFSQIGELLDYLTESDWVNENGELLCRECRMIDEQMSPLAYLKVKPLGVEHMEEIIGLLKFVSFECMKLTKPTKQKLEEITNKVLNMLNLINQNR
jgi:hypothetical protein